MEAFNIRPTLRLSVLLVDLFWRRLVGVNYYGVE